MKKIPGIFKPDLNKEINNNEKAYYSFLEKEERSSKSKVLEDPVDTINRLVSNGSYIFNKKLTIITHDKTLNTKIAGRLGKKIVTMDGDTIDISDILEIREN